jgi:hypothetical protein
MQKLTVIVFIGLAAGLGACQAPNAGSYSANSQRELDAALDAMEVRLGEEQRSISNFAVNGFRPINESNVVVTSGVRDHYLLNLTIPCLGLPYAFNMRIDSRSSNITSFDNILVSDLGGQLESCQISKIYRLEDTGAGARQN